MILQCSPYGPAVAAKPAGPAVAAKPAGCGCIADFAQGAIGLFLEVAPDALLAPDEPLAGTNCVTWSKMAVMW